MIHPLAWMAWVGAILVPLSLTRNPFYLALILLWLTLVTVAIRPLAAGAAPIPVSPFHFALFVVTFSSLFNMLTVHFGSTVLFRLPELLPIVGGDITLEALIFGLLNGLVLSGIYAAFTVINRALPVRAVIRLIPRAFYPVAVVLAIAVTFVPFTLHQFQQIREAQAVRGHRLRHLRDWLPLLMPLLVGGLERALQLAEAMTARGFASAEPQSHDTRTRAVIVVGLVALLSGWLLRTVWGQVILGFGLLLVGAGAVLGALWAEGRRVTRTVYRPEPWTWRDWGVVLSAALTVTVFLLPVPGFDRTSIFYYSYPTLSWPDFDLALGAATLGLLGPALLLARREVEPPDVRPAEKTHTKQSFHLGDQNKA